jgi:hypothetical protein
MSLNIPVCTRSIIAVGTLDLAGGESAKASIASVLHQHDGTLMTGSGPDGILILGP